MQVLSVLEFCSQRSSKLTCEKFYREDFVLISVIKLDNMMYFHRTSKLQKFPEELPGCHLSYLSLESTGSGAIRHKIP